MKVVALSQAFDGHDRFVIDLECRSHAGTDGPTIYQHSAGAANLHFAALPCSLKTEVIADEVGK
jgi:hypothetical protein